MITSDLAVVFYSNSNLKMPVWWERPPGRDITSHLAHVLSCLVEWLVVSSGLIAARRPLPHNQPLSACFIALITSDLASVFCSLSRVASSYISGMAMTNDLPAPFAGLVRWPVVLSVVSSKKNPSCFK